MSANGRQVVGSKGRERSAGPFAATKPNPVAVSYVPFGFERVAPLVAYYTGEWIHWERI